MTRRRPHTALRARLGVRLRKVAAVFRTGPAPPGTVATPRHLDADQFWRKPDDLSHTHSYWIDPEPEVSGVLSADRIRAYNAAVGGIVHPFEDSRVRTAGYELSLGPLFVRAGIVERLTPQQPYLTVEPNSIVFVSVAEAITLPHWLAGQFDLRLMHIYAGVLLGSGPNVDPGFQGALSCPLHNISNQPLRLRLGDPFMKIIFLKATGAQDVAPRALEEAKARGRDGARGYAGYDLELWCDNWREPILFQSPSLTVSSSVAGLARDLKRIGTIGTLALLAAGLAVAALLAVPMMYTDGRVDSEREAQVVRQSSFEDAVRRELGVSARQQPPLAEQVAGLRRHLNRLERQLVEVERRQP